VIGGGFQKKTSFFYLPGGRIFSKLGASKITHKAGPSYLKYIFQNVGGLWIPKLRSWFRTSEQFFCIRWLVLLPFLNFKEQRGILWEW